MKRPFALTINAIETLAVRSFFAFLLVLTCLTAKPLQGQTTFFKVGDPVEAMFNGKWESAVVTVECDKSQGCYGYTVAQGTYSWFVKSAFVRAHTLTPAEQADADKSAAELAIRAKSGNGIGAQYGVREPTTCKSRTSPPATPPSPNNTYSAARKASTACRT